MPVDNNKNYWNAIGSKYKASWQNLTKEFMSKRETDFINYYTEEYKPKRILDIGVGNGRIMEDLIKNSPDASEIYGIDFSRKMVEICRKKFIKQNKVKNIKVMDISREKMDRLGSFDFVTAIRVLKYNKNWQEIIGKIHNCLTKNGVFVFTMPNNMSINRFFKPPVQYYKTNEKELKKILNKAGFKVIEITSFTKIPDLFYDNPLASNIFYAKLLISAEKLLELLLGRVLLGRMLFVAARKT